MESPKSYAAKLLQSNQGTRRKLMVFVSLALAVVIVTTAVLALHAQAMNHTRRVLECAYETHVHTLEECGQPDERTCGLADYVVHVHNADCYDADGKLVCPLKEERKHTHTASCLAEKEELICEQDGVTEAEAAVLIARYEPDHVHTGECYAPGERVLSCGQEEREAHAHTEACYAPGERVLGCGQAERGAHAHTDACYTASLTCGEDHEHTDSCYTSALSCGQEEQAGHAHTDACYTEGAPVLACGQDEHEAHAHADDCYTEGEPVAACGKGDAAPVSMPEHVHTKECYETVTDYGCGKLELHTHTDECYRIIKPGDPDYATYKDAATAPNEEIRLLTCEIPQLEEHVHGEECFTEVELTADEIAALRAQEMGIELRDLQVVYEDADVRVTVDYDTLSLVPESAQVALLNAATPLPEPTPNPLLVVEGEPEAADAVTTEEEGVSADAEAAPEAAEPEAAAPEVQPAVNENEAPAAAPAAAGSKAPEVVRAGLMAEGREWLPAATVTYTVQYLDNGKLVGEAAQYVYTPGGEMPTFPRSIARFYRECRTDAFIVTARYTEFAQIPEDAELRASIITDEDIVAAREAEYRAALRSEQAQMVSLMDIGFWLNEEEIQPAAPVEITVQLLGEDGLPEGEPITVVHFAADGAEVLPASVNESGAASFAMNGFSQVALGYTPDADAEGRVTMDHTFGWTDENGLFEVTFHITGVAGPYKEDTDAAAPDADAPEAGEPAGENEEEAAAPADGEDAAAGEPENAEAEEAAEPEAEAAEPPLANVSYLDFAVETLPDTDPAYVLYEQYAAGEGDAEALLNLAVLRYALTYNEVAMDLSDCSIEVTVTPTEKMQLAAAAYQLENAAQTTSDGKGTVLGADNETVLPTPLADLGATFSVIAPAAEGEELLGEQGTLQIGGSAYTARLENMEQPVSFDDVLASDELAALPAGDVAEVSVQSISFMIAPRAMQGTALENSVATFALPNTNPEFTVQYYAMLNLVVTDTDNKAYANPISMIDTTGKNLPKNGVTPELLYMFMDGKSIKTKETLTPVYQQRKFSYLSAPELVYTNALLSNEHYYQPAVASGAMPAPATGDEPIEFWMLRAGKQADSTDEADWYVYTCLNRHRKEIETIDGVKYYRYLYEAIDKATGKQVTLSFTNNSSHTEPWEVKDEGEDKGITYIPVKEGSVVRWVFYPNNKPEDFKAAFYDYDISNGYIYRALPPENVSNYRHLTAGDMFVGNALNTNNRVEEHVGENKEVSATANGVVNWGLGNTDWNKHFYTYTKEQGINSSGNYKGSGTKLAFGNVNTGTNLGRLTWSNNGKDNELNKYNNASYKGCTFKLVAGATQVEGDWQIKYTSGINAPKLFNEGSANGKASYDDDQYSLKFNRVGDTFTLTAVNGTGATDLDVFSNPKNSQGNYDGNHGKDVIWTNNFWPMDSAPSFGTGTHDVKFGASAYFKGKEHELRFGPITQKGTDYTFPESDDGLFHNSYFGMHYNVQFELDKEYIGPLEYYFFGDDDMWVFLDGELVCDIGGVHSSVGEYVNLWDYLHKHDSKTCYTVDEDGKQVLTCEQGDEGEHTLSFFYTERGASGSTCWMQFTLPSVTSLGTNTNQPGAGTLEIGKTVAKYTSDGTSEENEAFEELNNGDTFQFSVELKYLDGTQPDFFKAELYGADGKKIGETSILNGGKFELQHDQYIKIYNLPVGTEYRIREFESNDSDKYVYNTDATVTVNGQQREEQTNMLEWNKKEISGSIDGTDQVHVVQFRNKYYQYELPETGNKLTMEWYLIGGAVLVLAAAMVVRKRKKARV